MGSAMATTPTTTTTESTQSAVTSRARAAAAQLAPGEVINVNKASQGDLEKLPGIGPAKAQAIIQARPFQTPEDLMKVKGIKEKVFAKIKPYITVQ